MKDSEEHVVVHRAQRGDIDAFAELVERHRERVYRVSARLVGRDDADDVAQETFLRAFHRLRQYRADAPFGAWLLRIAHNAAHDTLERRRGDVPLASDDPDQHEADATPIADSGRTPADELEIGERRTRLAHKLTLLAPSHRAVLVLRDLEGLSYDEIASATSAPLGSVKGRIHRARSELIEILRTNTYDWELPDERSAPRS